MVKPSFDRCPDVNPNRNCSQHDSLCIGALLLLLSFWRNLSKILARGVARTFYPMDILPTIALAHGLQRVSRNRPTGDIGALDR